MFGFIFGTICLLALMRMMAWSAWQRHHGMGYAGGCHGGWRRGRGRGPAPFESEGFARAAGEVLKRRLNIDEDQEAVVDHALIDLRGSLKELMAELKNTKEPLFNAFRGETVDDAAIASAFARQDDALGKARREVVSALKQIHAVLRPDQRSRAADWASNAKPGWV